MSRTIISLVGCDGSGKSTLAGLVVRELERRGHKPVRVWSRFNNLTSKPLLAAARLCGHSPYEEVEGFRYGYHDFEGVWWLRWPFACLQALDANAAVACKLRQSFARGTVVVFERGPWDTLADVMVDTGCRTLGSSAVGRLMVRRVSGVGAHTLLIRRSKPLILASRQELRFDRKLDEKIDAYSRLAAAYGWIIVDNDPPLDCVMKNMAAWLDREGF